MTIVVAVLVTTVLACIQDQLVPCGDKLCPVATVCTPGGCATRDAVMACSGIADGVSCMLGPTVGTCTGGACHPAVCGNGVIDPGEVCDLGSDNGTCKGCSANCKSDESCGNGVVDPECGEQCDIGLPGLNGKGCSATCTAELEIWRPISIATPQGFQFGLAADARGLVLFGGNIGSGGTQLANTWQWDGAVWEQRTPPHAPPALIGYGMVYDSTRHRTVLFGGSTGSGSGSSVVHADTWEWDGVDWLQRSPAVAPPARQFFQLAYDPVRGRTVLFGGQDGSGTPLGDTWEWDGTTWSAIQVANPPSARAGCTLAYAADINRVVMIGGGSGSADTWEWDGATWAQSTPPPLKPFFASMAYDPANNYLVAVDGNATWTRAMHTWTATTITAPNFGGAIAYDAAATGSVEWVGNVTGDINVALWTGSAWQKPLTTNLPTAPNAIAYDPVRGRTVLLASGTWEWDGTVFRRFVGLGAAASAVSYDGSGVLAFDNLGKTSSWNGATWTLLAPSSVPNARFNFAMAYDSSRGRVVLYGGSSSTAVLGETWEWDGSAWLQRLVAGPPARAFHVMAFDPVRRRTVVFGGVDATPETLGDTWEWDGDTWTQAPTAVTPPARSNAVMAYDPLRERIVMFGGQTSLNVDLDDTWEWDGTSWTRRAPLISPSPRHHSALAQDFTGGLILFGGDGPTGTLHDLWRHRWESSVAPDRCLDNTDSDGDGDLGCADLDCWERCTPLCPPGVTGGTCGSSTPGCGSVCGPLEDYVICPLTCSPPP